MSPDTTDRRDRHARRWTTEKFQEFIGMWLRGDPIEAIAIRFELEQSGINKIVNRLRRNGIPLPRRKRGVKAGRRSLLWTQEEVEAVIRMRNDEMSTAEIAVAMDRTFYGVQSLILRLRNEEGIPVKSLGRGRGRLWDAEKLRASIAGRGLLKIVGEKP